MSTRTRTTRLLVPPALAFALAGGVYTAGTLQEVATLAQPAATSSTQVLTTEDGSSLTVEKVGINDCVRVARGIAQVTGANFWGAWTAARGVRGCGDTNANAICWASRQSWGYTARWVVWNVSGGMTDRC